MRKKRKQGLFCAQVNRLLRKAGMKTTTKRCLDMEVDRQGRKVRLLEVVVRGYRLGRGK